MHSSEQLISKELLVEEIKAQILRAEKLRHMKEQAGIGDNDPKYVELGNFLALADTALENFETIRVTSLEGIVKEGKGLGLLKSE